MKSNSISISIFNQFSDFKWRIAYIFVLIITIFGVLGINILNPTNIFDALFFFMSFSFIRRMKRSVFYFFLCNTIYVFSSFFYSVYFQGSHALDFLLIYKAFIYLIFLSFLVGIEVLNKESVYKIFHFFLIAFLIKYSYTFILGYPRYMISVFDENNFELMLLFLLFILKYSYAKEINLKDSFTVFLITFLSGSRSGVLIFFFVILIILTENINFKKFIIIIAGIPFLIAPIIFILIFRTSSTGLEGIDRFIFLQSFLYETKDFTILNFLFGTERITKLSSLTCSELSFYEKLFSFNDDGTCYSVILHSYILRVIFDHGIIPFFLLVYNFYILLRKSNYAKKVSVLALLVITLNSFSVSAFNSIYAILGLSFFIISKPNYDKE